MKVEKAIKKIETYFAKRGIEIEICPPSSNYWKHTFTYNGRIASFSVSHDGNVELLHVKGENQQSDPYTDYYPGSYMSNVKQLCEWMLPPLPKYPVGTLVRGKSNKRATRWKIAGKLGLVTSANGGSCQVLFSGVPPHEGINKLGYISERDLEKIPTSK